MAITTTDEKLAVMQWNMPFAPAIVLDETSPFSQGDQQQLLWGYPGILWPLLVPVIPTFFTGDPDASPLLSGAPIPQPLFTGTPLVNTKESA